MANPSIYAAFERMWQHLVSVLGNKADTTDIPTKTSQLNNDSGFLTNHQDISGKLDKAGGTMEGTLIAQNNSSYDTKQVRNIFLVAEGETLPAGSNGDICLVYKP